MSTSRVYAPTEYKAKDYSHLRGLHAISDEQIEVHLKLYAGYVNRTNALFARVAALSNEGKHADSAFQELKRRGHKVEVGPDWSEGRLTAASQDGVRRKAAANPRGMQGYAAGR